MLMLSLPSPHRSLSLSVSESVSLKQMEDPEWAQDGCGDMLVPPVHWVKPLSHTHTLNPNP